MKEPNPADYRPAAPTVAGRAPWLVVSILLILYIFSFIDRIVINMMVAPIERDLAITDFQMSLLQGPAFGIFYVVSGLGLGWAVDRFSKRRITAFGVTLWGLATFLGGYASNFLGLAAARTGVGIGESALTPAAHALIAENFPPKRLSTAMSIFTMGAVIGGGIAIIIGGAVVHAVAEKGAVTLPLLGNVRGWQAVFFAIGAATLLLLPLILLIREPGRRFGARAHALDAATPSGLRMIGLLRRDWRLYILMPIGFGCTNILVAAYLAWVPTFMMRSYGMNAGEVGLTLGLQNLLAGLIGQLGGAMLVDRLFARGVTDAHARYHVVGLFLSIPLMLLAFRASSLWGFLALSFAFYCVTYPFVAYAAAALQLYTPSHLRGRVSALFLAIITIIGTSIGPTATGFLTDHLFGDKARIGDALSLVTIAVWPLIVLALLPAARAMRALHGRAYPD